MSQPKFSVGEIVIRQAPQGNYSEYNGEYRVLRICTKKDLQIEYKNMLPKWPDGYHYQLENFEINLSLFISNHSYERFLRKKHTPSEDSFTSMMDKLKLGISEEV